MLEGSKMLARQLLRQLIWETFNRHTSSGGADIALVGSRRSGSTLLMQVIGHHKGMKSIDQPFSVYTATGPQMEHLPWPAGGFFVQPSGAERGALVAYMEAMRAGRLHVLEPWRFWCPDFHFRSDRLVLKTTDAHHILPLLEETGFRNILYFRHPVPQAISCARNHWGDKLDVFARNAVFTSQVLNAAQRAELEGLVGRVDAESELARYVLCWCLENMALFDTLAAGTPVVFYEDMVLDPDGTIDRLVALCDITRTPQMRGMLGNASVSVRGLSDAEGAAAIRDGDTHAMIGRWRKKVDDAALERVQGILDLFPGCPYSAAEILPRSSEASA
ncbi:hypothetical protein [Puniceibacterium confluentis]|uniref:hypothetical protein n=1 Tax=Puniceibacterium confluentis TaxID=1958944 RepID=UPI001C94F21D|nr:hypothetical protein [Puniceibacterium confluentis]